MKPATLGYRMPAEWETHEATWLVWPHNVTTWPGQRLSRVESAYLHMIEALLPHEKVQLVVADESAAEQVRDQLKQRKVSITNLVFRFALTADSWIRDFGPTFLKGPDHTRAWCKWKFNAWGGKYPDRMSDDQIFLKHADWTDDPCFDAPFILEGGSVDVNGRGICLTTEACLLHPNRNPQMSREQIEAVLKDYLGVREIVWLKQGLAGDDTDGHVDDLARFVSEDTLAAVFERDASHPDYPALQANWKILERYQKEKFPHWNLVRLPAPAPLSDGEGGWLPASYANFYIANHVVLVPVFQVTQDAYALDLLTELFPDRKVVGIDAVDLVYGLGAVHCLTQQQPA